MRINHNMSALNTYRNLSSSQATVSKNMEKLSSGLRINRAADDASGLAISEKMRSQIRGLEVAERNTLDAVSLIQTADGALQETTNMLQRMRELSVQAANGTLTDEERGHIQDEINQLIEGINDIANDTEFNDNSVFNKTFTFQIGANSGQTLDLMTSNVTATGLGVGAVPVNTEAAARTAITTIDNAMGTLLTERTKLGAMQNRLESAMNNLQVTSENMTVAESRIRDVDMAKELTESTKNNILMQAAQAMLSQANQMPQGVLQLLK